MNTIEVVITVGHHFVQLIADCNSCNVCSEPVSQLVDSTMLIPFSEGMDSLLLALK